MQRRLALCDRRRNIPFQHQPQNAVIELIVPAIGRVEIPDSPTAARLQQRRKRESELADKERIDRGIPHRVGTTHDILRVEIPG
jgi:hypothetical protein